MGFSSALIGSAMAFDFAMFHERAPKLKGSDISKAMETVLLEQNIYTEYLAEVVCYSKKGIMQTATRRKHQLDPFAIYQHILCIEVSPAGIAER